MKNEESICKKWQEDLGSAVSLLLEAEGDTTSLTGLLQGLHFISIKHGEQSLISS